MSDNPFNPPAFPCEAQGDRSVPSEHDYLQTGIHSAKFPGMSLRDWLAGQVLPAVFSAGVDSELEGLPGETAGQVIARTVYEMADAMLAHRALNGQPVRETV